MWKVPESDIIGQHRLKVITQEMSQLITPEIAEELLKYNNCNRPISNKSIEAFTKDMNEGRWKNDGATIRISKNNRLLDGQHRLTSIVATKKAQRMFIVAGLDDDTFDTIDTGKRRTPGDVLGIHGYEHPYIAGAAIRIIAAIKDRNAATLFAGLFQHKKLTNQEVLNIIKDAPGINNSVKASLKYPFAARLLSKGAVAGLHYLFDDKDPVLCHELFIGIDSGVALLPDSIIYQLRDKLIRNLGDAKKIAVSDKIILVIRAWNHLRKGEHNIRFTLKNNDEIKKVL